MQHRCAGDRFLTHTKIVSKQKQRSFPVSAIQTQKAPQKPDRLLLRRFRWTQWSGSVWNYMREWIGTSNAPALSDYSAWIYRRWEELQQGHPTAAPAPVCGSHLYFDACMISHKQYTKLGHIRILIDKLLKRIASTYFGWIE